MHSLRLNGLSIKSNGQALVVQNDDDPPVTLMNVDARNKKVNINGVLEVDTVKYTTLDPPVGKTLTSEVLDETATVISLATDLTIFDSLDPSSVTLDDGVDGQVKYISKFRADADNVVTITKFGGGDIIDGITAIKLFEDPPSGVTLAYNAALSSWLILGSYNISIA